MNVEQDHGYYSTLLGVTHAVNLDVVGPETSRVASKLHS